jgi:hypothetical protein
MVQGSVFIPTAIIPRQKAPGNAKLYPSVKPKTETKISGKKKAIIGPLIDLQK